MIWFWLAHRGAGRIAQRSLLSSLRTCRVHACARSILFRHGPHRRHRPLKGPRGNAPRRWKGCNGRPTGPAVESEFSTSGGVVVESGDTRSARTFAARRSRPGAFSQRAARLRRRKGARAAAGIDLPSHMGRRWPLKPKEPSPLGSAGGDRALNGNGKALHPGPCSSTRYGG
jgi:hypothetical protein